MDEKQLCCSICLFKFNETKHSPLVLQCAHTFCSHCLEEIYNSKGRIKCPACNCTDTRNVESIHKNYILLELIRGHSSLLSAQIDPFECKLHPCEQLVYICRKDRQPVCTECLKNHSGHDLIPLDLPKIFKQFLNYKELYENSSGFDL